MNRSSHVVGIWRQHFASKTHQEQFKKSSKSHQDSGLKAKEAEMFRPVEMFNPAAFKMKKELDEYGNRTSSLQLQWRPKSVVYACPDHLQT